MKAKEKIVLRESQIEELKKKLKEKRKTLFEARIKFSQGQVKNCQLVPQLKKDIAIILTIIREKELSMNSKKKKNG